MWRPLLFFAGLLLLTAVRAEEAADSQAQDASNREVVQEPAKRSPVRQTGVYGAQYIDAQELAPEYLALLQQYLEAQQQQHQHRAHAQPQQHVSRGQLSALLEQELAQQLAQQQQQQHQPRAHHQQQQHQAIPLDVEQYHVETSPRRPIQSVQHQQLYYPVAVEEPVAHPRPAPVHQPQPAPPPPPPPPPPQQQQHAVEIQPQQLRYHQSIPIQYGYEDQEQIQREQHNPESVVRAQAQAEAQALAFQKVAQASHIRHQSEALEQIRQANEKYRQEQSALEKIEQGEQLSEAGRQERIPPKDPESAYKAHLKAQATALVAEQRRAKEQAEYKEHAEAILKLQAQQRAHLKAQEEAHNYALNFEENQKRAQEHAQAVANAQALALYQARQQALAKAQTEAKQAAKAQHEARKLDPNSAPVVQYLLPNKVALPAPEVYLPKAAEALRAQAAHEKRLKKPQHQVKHHQLYLEDIDPQLLRRVKPEEPGQKVAFLVDAGYYRKHHQQPQRAYYQGLQEVEVAAPTHRQHYAQYQQQHLDPDKLALLLPVEPQQGP